MSKTEIIAELAHLSPQDLADVRAWIDRLTIEKSNSAPRSALAHIRTPRLANPAQAPEFTKHVTELPADAPL